VRLVFTNQSQFLQVAGPFQQEMFFPDDAGLHPSAPTARTGAGNDDGEA
jgi:hypothetical protein